MEDRHFILFLGSGSNSLHLMAEGIAAQKKIDGVSFISASMTSADVHPMALSVSEEKGADIGDLQLRTPLDIELFMFDLVITIGEFDQNCRPNLPGMPPSLHWNITEPRDEPSSEQIRQQFRTAFDDLSAKVKILFQSDLLHALFVTRKNLQIILDNLVDGVMAHTTSRRIFYFNRAAEQITGYKREDVLGKDCHDVFPGRFCGGVCLFCHIDGGKHLERQKKELTFVRPDGEERSLAMATMPLSDSDDQSVGALISFKDNSELAALRQRLKHHHSLGGMVGKDPKMLSLFDQIREVGAVNAPVLIEGESGTGKELVANAIHEISPRSGMPLVAINCGALPEGVLESELFGHVKGAFTGAIRDKKGRFELADGGTLFLDEVSELSTAMQVKLLRVLQEQRFERVGGEQTIQVDVRIISATNRSLRKMMERGKFRSDLFYRLCVVPIKLYPLRERKLDIPMLVEHFTELIGEESGKAILAPSVEVIDVMTKYPWPGNVRELRNAIEYAYVKCYERTIQVQHLPPEILSYQGKAPAKPGPHPKLSKAAVTQALLKADGNKKMAAEELGVGRATLYRYLKNSRD